MKHKDDEEIDDSIGDAIIIGLFKVILGIAVVIGIGILLIGLLFAYCGDSSSNLHLDDPIDTFATDTAIEDTTK